METLNINYFAAEKLFMLCQDFTAFKGNCDFSVARKVMMQEISLESAIQACLFMRFASAEFYFTMIFYKFLMFELRKFSQYAISLCTNFANYRLVCTKLVHSVEGVDADGEDQNSYRSGSTSASGEGTSYASGSFGRVSVGRGGLDGGSAAGGDDGDDERGGRKEFLEPRSGYFNLDSSEEEEEEDEEEKDETEREELKEKAKSDAIKNMIGGCGQFGNYFRRKLEEEKEREEAETHRQAMIAHYEAWERSNAAARTYVRKYIAKVEPEASSSGEASGSKVVYDENHPAFTMAFAVPVQTPGTRILTRSEPAASSSHDEGNADQAVSDVAPTVSNLEEEDSEAE